MKHKLPTNEINETNETMVVVGHVYFHLERRSAEGLGRPLGRVQP